MIPPAEQEADQGRVGGAFASRAAEHARGEAEHAKDRHHQFGGQCLDVASHGSAHAGARDQ